jgi:outer membrane protein assembly factor BamB
MIYIGAYDGSAYAVNKEGGTCAWEFETDDPIVGGVVLGDAGLYVPSSDGYLYLVDPETGDEIERFLAGELWATPLLSDDAVYNTTMEGEVWKLDLDTLEPVWGGPFDAPAALLTAPSGDEGPATIVAGGIGNHLYGLEAETGDETWSFKGGNWFWGRPLVEENGIYATNLDGKIYALDLVTGEEIWSFDTGEKIRGAAAWTGDAVIVVNELGDAYSLDPETGQANWGPTEIGEKVFADAVVIDGEVVVVTRNGDVITIDDAGLPTTVVDG